MEEVVILAFKKLSVKKADKWSIAGRDRGQMMVL